LTSAPGRLDSGQSEDRAMGLLAHVTADRTAIAGRASTIPATKTATR